MSLLLCLKNRLQEESGFSLLEMLVVIVISSALTAVLLISITNLYQDNNFFTLHNSWQLDSYLALDFIAEQLQNSLEVEIISDSEIDIYTYFAEEYQWLKFTVYESSGQQNLGRILGGENRESKDFGRKLSLLDDIEQLRFQMVEPGLIKIKLLLSSRREKIAISRLIKIENS